MNLDEEIILAIKARGLKEMLQREEQNIRARRRRVRIALWSVGSSGGFAIAAAIALLLVISPMANQMKQFSNDYVSGIDISDFRGGSLDGNQVLLLQSIRLMASDQWTDAKTNIDLVREQVDRSSQEDQFDIIAQSDWLDALYWMHEGKVFKAKRLLKKISQSESPYSERAKELLEKYSLVSTKNLDD